MLKEPALAVLAAGGGAYRAALGDRQSGGSGEFGLITVLVGVVTGLAAGGAYSGAKALKVGRPPKYHDLLIGCATGCSGDN